MNRAKETAAVIGKRAGAVNDTAKSGGIDGRLSNCVNIWIFQLQRKVSDGGQEWRRHPQLGDPGTLSHQVGIQRQKSGGASNAFGDRVNRFVNCVLITPSKRKQDNGVTRISNTLRPESILFDRNAPRSLSSELRLDKRPTSLVRLKRDRSKCENTLDKLFLIEWAELLIPTHSVAEIMLRGTVMYLSLFVILRFVMVRQTSTIGIADILVIVVIADAAQNGFAKEYKSLTEGIVLVLTIVFWNLFLNWISYRFKALERLLSPPPLPLVKNGKMNRRNMRQEFITEEELRSQLRQQGIAELDQVREACLEANGELSVIKSDSKENSPPPKSAAKPV